MAGIEIPTTVHATRHAGGREVNPLQLWCLSTFRVTSFMIAVVIWQFAGGSLAEQFRRLGTGIGFLAFGVLWACTWFATRWGLRTQSHQRTAPSAWGPPMIPTVVAGGWNGLLLFVPLLAIILFTIFASGELTVPRMLMVLLLAGCIGGAIAFGVGALVGFAYGLVEAILLGVSDRIDQWAAR